MLARGPTCFSVLQGAGSGAWPEEGGLRPPQPEVQEEPAGRPRLPSCKAGCLWGSKTALYSGNRNWKKATEACALESNSSRRVGALLMPRLGLFSVLQNPTAGRPVWPLWALGTGSQGRPPSTRLPSLLVSLPVRHRSGAWVPTRLLL